MELPLGFKFAGVTAGIKPSGQPDLAIVVSDHDAVAAGVYTQNVIRAASIDYNRGITPTKRFRGLVINSGNANACTGPQGIADNLAMARQLADAIDATAEQILVLSTGVIGRPLPVTKVCDGIGMAVSKMGSCSESFLAACTAIITTDNAPKQAHRSFSLAGQQIAISAMAKGAGMIGPNMATMLAVLVTDAALHPQTADQVIRRVADRSFNCISVEGHTSTNDALILIANGARCTTQLDADQLQRLEDELSAIAIELAKQIPSDGEGATHLIEISVSGAASDRQADQIARSIANSALVKSAIFGGDPNWGRIVSAAGYCGVPMVAQEISLWVNGYPLFDHGAPLPFEAKTVSQSIKDNFLTNIQLKVGKGTGRAIHWTSDLTIDYVRFNSEYTT